MKILKISRTANADLQHKINRSVIFNYLRENGPTFRARISKDLNISAPAVSRVIDKLIEDGYVIETEKLITGSGKRPIQLKINSEKGIVIGIDLIIENIEIAISDLCGKVLTSNRGFKFFEDINVKNKLIAEVKRVLHGFKHVNGNNYSELMAMGVGVPAVTDINSGAVIDAPLYGSLSKLNLKAELEKEFNIPVYVENVVRLSALGEKIYGEGKNFKDVVFVEISNGIGAGIIIDNHLIRGTYGSAGEIGLSIIGTENLCFKIRNKGYLESIASVESLKERAIYEINKGKRSLMIDLTNNDLTKLNATFVCTAALNGDKVASDIINDVVKNLSVIIIHLILTLNPQIVILGGDICRLPEVNKLFIDPVANYVKKSIPFAPPKITISSLGEKAGVMGAAFFAIESLLTGEFPYILDY